MTPLRSVLIANRGEIAVRIIKTCRAMGLESVAVYSDADRDALHVRLADRAVPIGGSAPRESYLNIPAIVEAARRSQASAIHPGYGFLAENADFAAACEQAGITFIGPQAKAIRAMGSKAGSRKLAQEAGVPVVPGSADEDFATLGLPVLIKASAGGGGRGMRVVRSAGEFPAALAAARGEAERAFGDGSLLVEKYVEHARHVEIQIFGDHHGNVMHLYERDCSIQRRHQKIIEESPSPAVTPEIRERMAAAALALAKKIGYTSAGTVEFLLAPSGEFYFIEVNTRIQVEHPVTEMITGLDLIRLQIEVAQGARLPSLPPMRGHAIEARLYAEDPANNFLPSTGNLQVWQPPQGIAGLRVDSGVEKETEVSVHYDPLLAKVIAHGPDRESVIRKLSYALSNFYVLGPTTNREFLIDVLEHEEFRTGKAHTETRVTSRSSPQAQQAEDEVAVTVAAVYGAHREHAQRRILPSVPVRYRNNPYPHPAAKFRIGEREYEASDTGSRVRIAGVKEDHVDALVEGIRRRFTVSQDGDEYYVCSNLAQRKVTRLSRYPRRHGGGQQESANSPMPGQVLRIMVTAGQKVKPGDALVTLEAMKMEQTIKANMEGVVRAILVRPGEMVAPGQMLVEIESTEENNEHARGANPNG
ncbi:MAG TPA: biotin carboxylase N-terminal domain-containing protein [Candidatus Angelobacter sp.]|nr:biotin carboxylase N-terminal domain-containing protein [Candidatus Angelobacter sp.]